jgi:DNA-binding beta-propeller fold protein YncE
MRIVLHTVAVFGANDRTRRGSFLQAVFRGTAVFRGAGITSFVVALFFLSASLASAQSYGPVEKVLTKVADVPMPGPAVRFDYQSFDPSSGRLYIAHMNADQLVIFDTAKRQVVANLDGFPRVHGVTVAGAIHRVYASATGSHQVVTLDTETLKILGRAGPIVYPDGLAYAPKQKRIFVSDEHGGVDAVIDAASNKLITNIRLGGGAGNTVYDPVSGDIVVAVHGVNVLAIIDPETNRIIRRLPLAGIENPHGIALDVANHIAFVAGEENHTLAMVDLNGMKVLSTYQVGDDPDVLAYDPGLKRLYVSAESGRVTVFGHNGTGLTLLGSFDMPHAHTVSVDPKTHLVYFPLENVAGRPVLRIMRPTRP